LMLVGRGRARTEPASAPAPEGGAGKAGAGAGAGAGEGNAAAAADAPMRKFSSAGEGLMRKVSFSDISSAKSQYKALWTVRSKDYATLDDFFRCLNDGKSDDAGALMTDLATWDTLYFQRIQGRAAILEWRERERQSGRRNKFEGEWSLKSEGSTTYTREMKVAFPSGATHRVVQTVTLDNGRISHVEVKPKFPALGTALKFAMARTADDDEEALEQVSDDVEWTAWDGFRVSGKEGLRKLFRDQKVRESKRAGESEFKAVTVNEQGAVFERLLYIERIDGIRVRSTQRLYIQNQLHAMDAVDIGGGLQRKCYGIVPRIVAVRVLATEEMIDGEWTGSCDNREE